MQASLGSTPWVCDDSAAETDWWDDSFVAAEPAGMDIRNAKASRMLAAAICETRSFIDSTPPCMKQEPRTVRHKQQMT
jgi:hypothetical protein